MSVNKGPEPSERRPKNALNYPEWVDTDLFPFMFISLFAGCGVVPTYAGVTVFTIYRTTMTSA